MPIAENKGSYLLLTANEPYTFEGYKGAIDLVLKLCEESGLYKVVTDIRSIDRNIPTRHRFDLGVTMAKVLGSKVQLAVVAPAGIIDHLGENAAVNRGARMWVTPSMEKALAWLGVAD